MMKKILILHTGGTISMAEDENGHAKFTSSNCMLTAFIGLTAFGETWPFSSSAIEIVPPVWRILSRGKPIVLTGAMRSSNELGTDGIYNLLTAIRVAADSNSSDRGVLVVMNDEIHSARYVTKTHTTNVSTFQTPTHGPVGLLTKNKIIYFHKDSENQHLDVGFTTRKSSVKEKSCFFKCVSSMCNDHSIKILSNKSCFDSIFQDQHIW